jgi:UDP-N-acetylglucosamine 2-epimerase (non-hydrolysing)/GDP/UDP-N,N'-diacetylbacillosamine 2-epimerase (hydrolysing)
MHFSPEFGETWRAIEADGIPISHRVEMLSALDTPFGVAQSTGEGLSGMARVFDSASPDLVIVLGDRFETLAAAQAAFLMGIPVAHIAGGEVTEGAIDDSMRHAITKFSSLHFVSAEAYRRRVIQLGEPPESVFDVGAIGLDNFAALELMAKQELEVFLDFPLDNVPFFLCTQHPQTMSSQAVGAFIEPLFAALDQFPDVKIVMTRAYADAGGRELNSLIDEFADARHGRVKVFASLGQLGYLSAITAATVVIGNSSSGILEAPSAGTPTVNIGDRQKGRLRAASVVDVDNDADAIAQGIIRAMAPQMQALAGLKGSPYGSPGVSRRIADILETTALAGLRSKSFYDLEWETND